MTQSNETPIFSERQYFPLWLRTLMLALMAATAILAIAALFHKTPESGRAATGVIIAAGVLVPLATGALMWFYHMETRVCSDGIYVRCFPLHLRFHHFPAADIAKSYARKYQPIREYGGWGIRYGLRGHGRAYNVSGNEGVQLIFKNGKKLLIGSHQPQQLESALHSVSA